MGVLKKYIRAYLLAYGVFGVVSLIVFFVLEKLSPRSSLIGGIIILLYCLCLWGVPLCYAFPEFKRKIKLALVRIIILDLLFCLLFFVWFVVCGGICETCGGICETCGINNYGSSLFMIVLIVLIVVSFPFFGFISFCFIGGLPGRRLSMRRF